MQTIYQEENSEIEGIDTTRLFVTSNPSFWTAMMAINIHPYRVALTDQAIEVSYPMEEISNYIPAVTSGNTEIDELSAHGSTVMWKALIGVMKMLSRYEVDTKFGPGIINAYTTDQYLVWVLGFRGIIPVKVSVRGRDAAFEFEKNQIPEIKKSLFSSYIGDIKKYSSMKNIWRQAKNYRQAA